MVFGACSTAPRRPAPADLGPIPFGGKSTVLVELGRRGYTTVDEPGRRIVKEEMLGEGVALSWVDAIAFARRAIALALADRNTCLAGWVFF
jgi:predicted ATPase